MATNMVLSVLNLQQSLLRHPSGITADSAHSYVTHSTPSPLVDIMQVQRTLVLAVLSSNEIISPHNPV